MSSVLTEGGVGSFGFPDLANFWFGFSVFALKNCGFRFGCFGRFAGFLQFSLWFSVFVNSDGGFKILLPNSFYGFSGFAKDVAPRTHAKTVIPRNQLQLEECMTSLNSLAAIIWVVTAAKQRRRVCWVWPLCRWPLPHYSLFCGRL